MDLGLKDKNALVTGGSRGLGLASAISLAKERIGLTGSNPSVGCVVVKDNEIIVAFRNSVASFSLPNGKLLWKKNLNGARIWSGVSYDDETETLIFVTSNLVHLIGDTDIENDFSNSVVLLDTKSGEVRCKFKDTIHDHWDYDMVGNPIIINSKNSNLAYGFSKTGNIFVINKSDRPGSDKLKTSMQQIFSLKNNIESWENPIVKTSIIENFNNEIGSDEIKKIIFF